MTENGNEQRDEKTMVVGPNTLIRWSVVAALLVAVGGGALWLGRVQSNMDGQFKSLGEKVDSLVVERKALDAVQIGLNNGLQSIGFRVQMIETVGSPALRQLEQRVIELERASAIGRSKP